MFRDIIYFLLNPYITTGISEKKIGKEISKNSELTIHFSTFIDLTHWVSEHNTGTDEIINIIQKYIEFQPSEMHDFLKSIITKSLKLGCDYKTINKVFGKGFIPSFECMLAEKYFDHVDFVKGKSFTLTTKLDGIRCLLIKKGNQVSVFSRQGQPIIGLVDVDESALRSKEDFVLDGELLTNKTEGILSKDQYKETTKIVRSDGIKHNIIYHVFDCMSIEQFETQNGSTPYWIRHRILEELGSQFGSHIQVLPILYSGSDGTQIYNYLDKARAEGQEGIMININSAPYEFKRTKNLLKCKVMQDCDLKIIGFEEGQGRLVGTLGRLNVNYKDNTLGVGSGFSDEDRKFFWENREELIGRVVSVQYFEETQNKNGKLSLRFPVYKELREIEKEVSYC